VTESSACSRLNQRTVHAMANSSPSFRDRAEQAFRLARQRIDPILIKRLNEVGQECLARAEAFDGPVLGKDRSEDDS
jgi:hypothetical protein